MAINMTTSTPLVIGLCDAVRIQVNAALTGTIVVATGGSTQYGTTGATLGTVTNPGVGNIFTYRRLRGQGAVTITPSTTCDLTVAKLGPMEA